MMEWVFKHLASSPGSPVCEHGKPVESLYLSEVKGRKVAERHLAMH